jgi:putative transposase
LIEPLTPVYAGGRPRTTNLRDVVDAVFYVLCTGCQWRCLPKVFPPKSTVWRYFDECRHNDTLDAVHDLLPRKVPTAEKPYPPDHCQCGQPVLWPGATPSTRAFSFRRGGETRLASGHGRPSRSSKPRWRTQAGPICVVRGNMRKKWLGRRYKRTILRNKKK